MAREVFDRCYDELEMLVKNMATQDQLMLCTALLDLLPWSLGESVGSAFDRARILHRKMMDVLDRAYVKRISNPKDEEASKILAAGALLGLFAVDPANARTKPSHENRKATKSILVRKELAGTWPVNPIGRRQVDTNYPSYLRAFLTALIKSLHPEPAPAPSVQVKTAEAERATQERVTIPGESAKESAFVLPQPSPFQVLPSHSSADLAPEEAEPESKRRPSRRTIIGWAAGLAFSAGAGYIALRSDEDESAVTISARAVRLKDEGNMTVVPGDFKPDADMQRLFATPGAATDNSTVKEFLRREGVNHEELAIRVTVTGPQDLEVLEIKPIISKKHEPLNGTLFHIGTQGQGGNPTIRASIDLDKQAPVARELVYSDEIMASPTPGRPLSELETFPIGEETNGKRVFVIQAVSLKHYVEFTLEFAYSLKGQDKTATVDDDGKPFRVTGNRCDYKQVYVPQGDYSLVLKDYPTCDE